MWRKIAKFFGRLLLIAFPILIVVDAWVAYSQPMYYAESVILINEPRSNDIVDCFCERPLARTYAHLLKRNTNLEQASERLGYSFDEIMENTLSITVRPLIDTQQQTVFVHVGSTSPELSVQMANMLPTVLIDQLDEQYGKTLTSLQQRLDELQSAIEQTNSEVEAYLALGDEITEQESDALAQLQNSLAQSEINYSKALHSREKISLAQVERSDLLKLIEAATLPTSPRQPIFFDLFNSAIHMQLDDRFVWMYEDIYISLKQL